MNPLRIDPTRTGTQRRLLEREIIRRLKGLKQAIVKLVVTDDVFGLRDPLPLPPTTNKAASTQVKELVFSSMVYSDPERNYTELTFNVFCATGKGEEPTTNTVWRFLSSDEKLREFMDWVKVSISTRVLAKSLALGKTSDDHWLTLHIEQIFKKGMQRAFDAVRKPQLKPNEKLDYYNGTREEFIRSSFFRPVAQERVKLLASRAFNELQGVTNHMATQIQRTLTDGFIRGDSPYDIAKALSKDVDNLGIARAERLARTEVVRAHNEGQLESLENLGVGKVGVSVEWSTSGLGITKRGNPSPCRLCAPLKGVVFSIKDARGKLPRHPNCLCSWIPAGVGESQAKQIRTRDRIQTAVDKSLLAERPKKSKRTLIQQRKRSRWLGAFAKVKAAPKGIL